MVKKVIKGSKQVQASSLKNQERREEVSKTNSNRGNNVEIKLIENFVSLQKVMVNLSAKFDELSKNISKLLELFELSATALAKKDINFTKQIDEEKIMGKLNNILEQNKTIARGLALMSEGGEPGPKWASSGEKSIQPVMPQFRQSPAPSPIQKGEERYQKSPFKGF